MLQATLRARLGVIAALTVLATLVFGATLSMGAASATSRSSVSGPVQPRLTSPSPTASSTASPTPTATPTATPTTRPAPKKTPTAARPKKATTNPHARARARMMRVHALKVRKVLHEASAQKGKPYVYGADGPGAFDCSGLVRYVFMHALHRSLPHNAAEQYYAVKHIRRSQLRPGDLVFVDDGGYISHVGIFAGHHHWWVAPHTGTRVQRQRIYSAHFLYGRVIRFGTPMYHAHKNKHH